MKLGNRKETEQLRQANQALSQRVYQLHNIFRISLELTSLLDRDRLQFAYLVNTIGLMRSSGAALLLPDSGASDAPFVVAAHRGFPAGSLPDIACNRNVFRKIRENRKYAVCRLEEPAGRALLEGGYDAARLAGVALVAPLIQGDETHGVVLLGHQVNGRPYRREDLELLALVNNFFAVVLQNSALVTRLERLSATDGLTRLQNRRAFDIKLEEEVERGRRYGVPFSLVLGDIDHFKQYNDQNGHPAGDALLKQFAEILNVNMRNTDFVARYGGEEFAILLLGMRPEPALQFCHRLRARIEETTFPNGDRQPLGLVSASFGTASFPAHAQTAESLVKEADHALYAAKMDGRNCVRQAGQLEWTF